MMQESGDTLSAIFEAQIGSNETDRLYWLWLGSAYSILRSRASDICEYRSNLERSYGAAKQIVMELWAIRAFLSRLKIETDSFDKIVPNLKAFRDAIAHIDERAEGKMLVRGGRKDTNCSKQNITRRRAFDDHRRYPLEWSELLLWAYRVFGWAVYGVWAGPRLDNYKCRSRSCGTSLER